MFDRRSRDASPLSLGAVRLIRAQRPPLSMSEARTRPRRFMPGGGLRCPEGSGETAQAAEAVGGREPERCEFAERFLELMAQEARGFRQLVKEQSAARVEAVDHGLSASLIGATPLTGASAIHNGVRRRSMRAIGVAPTGDTWRDRPLPLAAAGGVSAPRTCARRGIRRRAMMPDSP